MYKKFCREYPNIWHYFWDLSIDVLKWVLAYLDCFPCREPPLEDTPWKRSSSEFKIIPHTQQHSLLPTSGQTEVFKLTQTNNQWNGIGSDKKATFWKLAVFKILSQMTELLTQSTDQLFFVLNLNSKMVLFMFTICFTILRSE